MTKEFKVPMNNDFLPQTQCVQLLLDTLHKSVLPNISNHEAKNVIVCFSSIFTHERTVCSLSLIDVINKAQDIGLSLSTEQALKLLDDAVKDVRDNYASKAIQSHLDLYAEELERANYAKG